MSNPRIVCHRSESSSRTTSTKRETCGKRTKSLSLGRLTKEGSKSQRCRKGGGRGVGQLVLVLVLALPLPRYACSPCFRLAERTFLALWCFVLEGGVKKAACQARGQCTIGRQPRGNRITRVIRRHTPSGRVLQSVFFSSGKRRSAYVYAERRRVCSV